MITTDHIALCEAQTGERTCPSPTPRCRPPVDRCPVKVNGINPFPAPVNGRTSVHTLVASPALGRAAGGGVFLAGGLGRDLKLAYKVVKYSVLSQLFCVNAGSSLSIQTDFQPEKVTSTCSERLAQLDPHCPPMLLAACKRSRAGADACRLSLA